MTKRFIPDTRATLVVAALALTLAGCQRAEQATGNTSEAAALPDLPATLPLATGTPSPVVVAPAVAALPAAPPIRAVRTVRPDDDYAYADNADRFADALGAAPPDYGFDQDGVDPWAWQGYDDSLAFAEPVADGYRYYYYRPGADQPYFVRDADYGYGYDGGQLAVIYAAGGAIVPYRDYGPRLDYASRYLRRGRDLYAASRRRRAPVIAAAWAARGPAILGERRRWADVRQQQAGWAHYREQQGDRAARHWQEEAARRQADTQRYHDWAQQRFVTPPPPRAIPVAWQQAPWARDPRRFAPAQRPAAVAARDLRANERAAAQRNAELAQRSQQQQLSATQNAQRQQAIVRQQQSRQQTQIAQRQQRQAAQAAQRQQAVRVQDVARQQVQNRAAQQRQVQTARRAQLEQARQQAQLARQQQQTNARTAQHQQAQRQQAQLSRQRAQTAQRQQAQAARQQTQAVRRQAQVAQQRQAQTAERQRSQAAHLQAQAAQRQQVQAARQQAQAAQRQQAQAARQQAQASQRQQTQAARQQAQAAHQQAQAARAAHPPTPRPAPAAAGPRPNGGGEHGHHGR